MSSASLASLRNIEATPNSPSPSQQQQQQQQHFSHRTVETQVNLLGLATPASRPLGPSATSSETGAFVYLKQRRGEEEKLASGVNAATDDADTNAAAATMDLILNFNEPLLPSRRHLILQVFSAIDNVSDLQVSSAALRIIAAQAEAVQFEPDPCLYGVAPSRLFSILEEEPGALNACLSRFKRRLEREETETVQLLADAHGFEGVLSVSGLVDGSCLDECPGDVLDAFGLTNLIRLQIVDFLARNVKKRSYNLAHFLLGLDNRRQLSEASLSTSCLPLLIDMLTYGLGHASSPVPVLFTEHPALGVKLLQLLNALLPSSQSVWMYLREERDLFAALARDFGAEFAGDEENSSTETNASSTAAATSSIGTIYALLQRTELFRLLAMDIHEASQKGDSRYAEGVIEGLLADSTSGADCRLISFLAGIDGLVGAAASTSSSSESAFEGAVRSELSAALIAYTDTWAQLTGCVLSNASRACVPGSPTDPLLRAAVSKLHASLQIWLSRLLSDSMLPAGCVESLVQLCVNIDGGAGNTSASGNESSPLLSSASVTSALLRPDLSPSARCFLYTALMKTLSGSGSSTASGSDALLKVGQIACRDVLSPEQDDYTHSLVSVAAGCLEALLLTTPVPLSFPSTLVSSLIVDDSTLAGWMVSSADTPGSALLKWKAKWSLLMALLVNSTRSSEVDEEAKQDDLPDCSFISRLSALSSLPLLLQGLERSDVFVHLILPVLKFASLTASGNIKVIADEWMGRLLGRIEGSEVDYHLLSLINRRLLSADEESQTAPSPFIHEILKISLKSVNLLLRSCRLGSTVDASLLAKLEECFSFLSLSSHPSSIALDFSLTQTGSLGLGHLCQLLQYADKLDSPKLIEKTLWLMRCTLHSRLGHLLPVPGMTAVYLQNSQSSRSNNSLSLMQAKALRSDAQVYLWPLLESLRQPGIFVAACKERIRELIFDNHLNPIISL